MSRKKDKNKEQAQHWQVIYSFYFAWLKNIAMSIFEWQLPDSMNARFLELAFFEDGRALAYVKDGALINTRANPSNNMDMYNYFTGYTGYNVVFSDYVDADKCVYGLNNPVTMPTFDVCDMFATRLQKLEMGIWCNVDLQKFPIMVSAPESQKLSVKNLMEQFEGGLPFLYTYRNFEDLNQVKCFDMKVPQIFDKLYELKQKTLNEFLEFLGVTTPKEKKERLLSGEIIANNSKVGISGASFLWQRQEFARKINEKFSAYLTEEVTVKVRDYSEILHIAESEEMTDGTNFGLDTQGV